METCPRCGSQNIPFDSEFGFYWCQVCKNSWDYNEDDSDYDEAEEPTQDLTDT